MVVRSTNPQQSWGCKTIGICFTRKYDFILSTSCLIQCSKFQSEDSFHCAHSVYFPLLLKHFESPFPVVLRLGHYLTVESVLFFHRWDFKNGCPRHACMNSSRAAFTGYRSASAGLQLLNYCNTREREHSLW